MVKIRLRREGKKKQPVYKIIVADSRSSRKGKFIDTVGQYNPLLNPVIIDVNEDKLFKWLKKGAMPTDTTRSLLRRKGLWLKWSLVKKGADETDVAAALEKWQMQQAEKLQREAARKARRKAVKKEKATAEAPPAAQPAPVEAAPAAAAASSV